MEHLSPDRFLPFLDVLIHPGPDKSTSVYRKPNYITLLIHPVTDKSTSVYRKPLYEVLLLHHQLSKELSDLSLEEPTTSAPHNTWALNCRPSDTPHQRISTIMDEARRRHLNPSQTSTNHPKGSRLLPLRLPTLSPLPLQNLEENSWTARHTLPPLLYETSSPKPRLLLRTLPPTSSSSSTKSPA